MKSDGLDSRSLLARPGEWTRPRSAFAVDHITCFALSTIKGDRSARCFVQDVMSALQRTSFAELSKQIVTNGLRRSISTATQQLIELCVNWEMNIRVGGLSSSVAPATSTT